MMRTGESPGSGWSRGMITPCWGRGRRRSVVRLRARVQCRLRGTTWHGAPLLSIPDLVTSQSDKRAFKSSHKNSKTAQPGDPAAGNQEKQRRKTKIALFGKVQARARAHSYSFRAVKGMENFARSRLFEKAPPPALPPLWRRRGLQGPWSCSSVSVDLPGHCPRLLTSTYCDDRWVSSVVSAGARQACWLSSLCRRLVTFRAGGKLPVL